MIFKRIIISRTDSIGDVILTLPMAGMLKRKSPGCEIYFLGKSYTKDLVDSCVNIDRFIDWNEIEKKSSSDQISFVTQLKADVIIHVFPVKRDCCTS